MAAYFPYTQHIQYFGNFSVRSTGSREVLIPAVRHAIAQVNPNIAVSQVVPLDDQVRASIGTQRLINSQRADANYFTVDGVSANFGVTGFGPLAQTAGGTLPALSVQGGTNSLVSVDAMQEFVCRLLLLHRSSDALRVDRFPFQLAAKLQF